VVRTETAQNTLPDHRTGFLRRLWNQRYVQAMALPGIIWLVIFAYLPMWGIIIAFKQYSLIRPLSAVPWVGFQFFIEFVTDEKFWPVLANTLGISVLRIAFGFPLPIIFALFLNEMTSNRLKRTVQTVSYLPRFISWVVLGGIMMDWLSESGFFTRLLLQWGILSEPVAFLAEPRYFWGLAVISDIWKELGWSAIIYLAAIAGIDPQLYEAATIDGAGRYKKMWHITLPSIAGTIAILFILAVAYSLNSNFDQIFVLRNSLNRPASDVVDMYVYRMGIQQGRFSFATAVGLMRSVAALILLVSANFVTRRLTGRSLY
jgi:putative aldouronate transport system permease protein